MDAFLNALNMFFTTFKAAVFVPVFIFVIALAMGVKPKKAFFSALSAGVGLEGFSLVIGSYSPILSPIIDNMINAVGINLPIVDLGWQTTSIIAYSYQVGMIYIAVAIALQVILYLVHYTTVFQAGDLWNNYSYFAWGSCLFVLTGNFWLPWLAWLSSSSTPCSAPRLSLSVGPTTMVIPTAPSPPCTPLPWASSPCR